MPHTSRPPTVGRGRGLEGIDSCEGATSATPSPATQLELPRVAEARARDAAARAKLRGLIPEKMAKLESGKRWDRAEALRSARFGTPEREP